MLRVTMFVRKCAVALGMPTGRHCSKIGPWSLMWRWRHRKHWRCTSRSGLWRHSRLSSKSWTRLLCVMQCPPQLDKLPRQILLHEAFGFRWLALGCVLSGQENILLAAWDILDFAVTLTSVVGQPESGHCSLITADLSDPSLCFTKHTTWKCDWIITFED